MSMTTTSWPCIVSSLVKSGTSLVDFPCSAESLVNGNRQLFRCFPIPILLLWYVSVALRLRAQQPLVADTRARMCFRDSCRRKVGLRKCSCIHRVRKATSSSPSPTSTSASTPHQLWRNQAYLVHNNHQTDESRAQKVLSESIPLKCPQSIQRCSWFTQEHRN